MKQPNVKGPRFRKQFLTLRGADYLKAFKKRYPEYKDLTSREFRDIIKTFNMNLVDCVLENRNGVELPEGLGYIFIGTCPPAKKKNVDYKKSIEFGTVALFKNWDSDNRLMKIFYTNRNTKFPFLHREVWSFKAGKEFRHKASVQYRENWAKYVEVPATKGMDALFDRIKKKERVKSFKPIIPEDYNDFKL